MKKINKIVTLAAMILSIGATSVTALAAPGCPTGGNSVQGFSGGCQNGSNIIQSFSGNCSQNSGFQTTNNQNNQFGNLRDFVMNALSSGRLNAKNNCNTNTCNNNEDCKENDCLTNGNCDNNDCTVGSTCDGDDCLTNDCVNNDCTLGEDCDGDDCLTNDCVNNDCTLGEDCDGDDCLTNDCVNNDCTLGEDCDGDDCDAKKVDEKKEKETVKPVIKKAKQAPVVEAVETLAANTVEDEQTPEDALQNLKDLCSQFGVIRGICLFSSCK